MPYNSPVTQPGNIRILEWIISRGAAVGECILKSPPLIVRLGQALFRIESQFSLMYDHSGHMMQTISEDFYQFLQIAQNQDRTEEDLVNVQEKLAKDIVECLKHNVDTVCKILTIGVVLFDSIKELRDLCNKAQEVLKDIFQNSQAVTLAGVDFLYLEVNKVIENVNNLFSAQRYVPHLSTISSNPDHHIELGATPSIRLRLVDPSNQEDEMIESSTEYYSDNIVGFMGESSRTTPCFNETAVSD